MRRVQQKCYELNALIVLLALILCDRFSMDFAITVNPIETMKPSLIDYINYESDEIQNVNSKHIDAATSLGTKEYDKVITFVDSTFAELPDKVRRMVVFYSKNHRQKSARD